MWKSEERFNTLKAVVKYRSRKRPRDEERTYRRKYILLYGKDQQIKVESIIIVKSATDASVLVSGPNCKLWLTIEGDKFYNEDVQCNMGRKSRMYPKLILAALDHIAYFTAEGIAPGLEYDYTEYMELNEQQRREFVKKQISKNTWRIGYYTSLGWTMQATVDTYIDMQLKQVRRDARSVSVGVSDSADDPMDNRQPSFEEESDDDDFVLPPGWQTLQIGSTRRWTYGEHTVGSIARAWEVHRENQIDEIAKTFYQIATMDYPRYRDRSLNDFFFSFKGNLRTIQKKFKENYEWAVSRYR